MIFIINFVVWFWPIFLLKKVSKYSYLFSAIIFSQSYFIYPLIVAVFELDFFVVIIESYVE